MKQTILQKGLIIISIPLLFELFFAFVIIKLLDESSKYINAEMKSQDTIVSLETMIKEVADSTTSAILYNATRSDVWKERNEHSRQRLQKHYAKLRRLTQDDPMELDAVNKLFGAAMWWMREQDKHVSSEAHTNLSAFFIIPGQAQATMSMLMRPEGAIKVILDKERKEQAADAKLRDQNIINIEVVIVFGLIVNITITIFLAAYFARHISQRLDNVLSNTFRLGARQSLAPPLRGTDESAELDHALHATASEILAFEKFKEQLIGVVSHELRTPLTSVQGTLSLIEAGAMGEFSQRALDDIADAQNNLKRLITLVNNLLLLERLEAGSQILKIAECNASKILDAVIEETSELTASKQLNIERQYQKTLMIFGDEERLAQAFEIILDTCLQRSPDTGTISIFASEAKEKLEVVISDQGEQLSSSRIQSFFDRLAREDELEDRGDVLSHALCYQLISAHDGSITIDSSDDLTSFTVKLPLRRKAQ